MITGLQLGSAAIVAKPALELVKDFLTRILAPTGDALGQAVAHPIVEWQKSSVERAATLRERAAQFVAESGENAQAVPGRLLFPILERASVEDNSEFSERWAALWRTPRRYSCCNPGISLYPWRAVSG